ncbi:Glycosyl hydrolases family 39 [Izhakiella capsodis]|uniref:Glycosyl hydrolases family 39 n=1 Tax=Izhakiella capsodis TaxID=1367852 RepID=A0A1I4X2S9_9GAMM|nr:glycoside hydrolase family 39 [Izhakiella capsodis]SFN20321.1 Glycosyl hydrolases family 39 [Izhakiella capsodis]
MSNPVKMTIDKSKRDQSAGNGGLLKEVNGVNGIPVSVAPGFPDLEDQFNQMGITHIRMHDCLGIGDIDNYIQPGNRGNQDQYIPNVPEAERDKAKKLIADIGNHRVIYPNAAAGMRSNNVDLAFKEANYTMTDMYIKRILANNPALNPGNIQRQVMFRIGRTLDGGSEMPQDADIYATLISTLVDRYSLNYVKTGLARKVKYWEIWNEPDLNIFWNNNDPQNFYKFYSKVAKMIKAVDPDAKVGGAGVAAGYNPGGAYIDGLLKYCKETDTPLDFISWHYYAHETGDPQNIIDIGNAVQKSMIEYGYGDKESICTEWNSSPFASVNTFTKIQMAKGAAFIASTLSYMQYCKVDKAYFYRGDALSFGLFNDNPNPVNKNFKSFCTYAAQAFNLYARMFETPYILQQEKNFGTGITILACENAAGNKINILVSNFHVDNNFSNPNLKPAETDVYKQHYLDTNRTLDQLTDEWSLNEWFGGVNPNNIKPDNVIKNTNLVPNPPVYGKLAAHSRNYSESDNGLSLTIKNIGYNNISITAFRIEEGGDLSSMSPPTRTLPAVRIASNDLTLTDDSIITSTVTLYTISLS